MQINTPNMLNSTFPLAINKAKGNCFASKKIKDNSPIEITEPCQIKLGADFYLNSRNSRITDTLKYKNGITIGSDETCDIKISGFHDNIEEKHAKIFKDDDTLFIKKLTEKGEGEIISKENIKPFYKGTKDINLGQGNIGDCYLLATIRGLSQTEYGAELLNKMVKIDKNGNYVVTFNNKKPISVTINELNGENNKKSVSGDLGIKAIERAYGKIAKNNISMSNIDFLNIGGTMDNALKIMTGIDSKVYKSDKKEKEKILNEIATKGIKNYIVTCGSNINTAYGKFADKDKRFYSGHAYTIQNIDKENKTIELINPHNTKVSEIISWNEFNDIFNSIFVAEIPDKK